MSELDEQIRVRREKRERLRGLGIDAYPPRFALDLEPAEILERHGSASKEALEGAAIDLRTAGRVRSLREHGKSLFLDLSDGREKIQLFVRRDRLAPDSAAVLENLDLGDQLGVAGRLMRTRSGELSVEAAELVMLAKAVRPLPEKWHGLADLEARYRQRYLDLVANPESRLVFETRAKLVSGIRRYLDARGFIEVETPMMHSIPTGAAARPFKTHHNALDMELYLRIAPELYLKRLTVGGMHRVYEINRNFRNEGLSTRHNPEFTMLEFYQAYADYRSLMDLSEEMVVELADTVLGRRTLNWKGGAINLERPWRRLTMRDAIVEVGGVEAAHADSIHGLHREHERRGIPVPQGHGLPSSPGIFSAGSAMTSPPDARWYGYLLVSLFEALVEEKLQNPTFIHDYPVEVSPLAKHLPGDPRFTERFELYIGGMEIANAFTELNDPEVQAERFRGQLARRESGDDEAHAFDADYVTALEHAMPPTGGEGIGIDRLTMLFTDRASIRDVILFPLMRPQREGGGERDGDRPPGS